MKISNKQKEVIMLMRKDEKLRIHYEFGLTDCVILTYGRSVGKYPISCPTALKLDELGMLKSDGTEKRQAERRWELSWLGKNIQL